MKQTRLWDHGANSDAAVLKFTVGQDPVLDVRLVPHDIRASIAHVRMLGHCGHLTPNEAGQLEKSLNEIGTAFAQGEWVIEWEQEDCHTAIEGHLTNKLGPLGGKVHLGRSRNDQVLAAMRLYLNAEITLLDAKRQCVCTSLEKLDQSQGEILIPGYTHMQQAMPSTVRLWALGFRSLIEDNCTLLIAAGKLLAECPLGSAAGYGTPGLTLDRELVAKELGFARPQHPVTACQLSRGKAEATFAFALTQVLADLGRMATDLCLFATQEFGFVRLDPSISTGSSIMPQKRNPDVFELIRGHASQAPADLLAILNLTSKLPSGYHRDLQLLKEPLFRLIDRAHEVLEIAAFALQKIQFCAERAQEVTSLSIHAASQAFALVQETGASFREAYHQVARQFAQD